MNAILNRLRCMLQISAALLPLAVLASAVRADICQWEYIDPADPSQGKRQSTTLAPDGAGVDAIPGADIGARNLTMAYLIGANLTTANFLGGTLTDADFTGAQVRAANFSTYYDFRFGHIGSGISLAQLYSTKSYQAHDLSGIVLGSNNLAGGNFAGQNLTDASLAGATLTGADFSHATLTNASFANATLTDADFTGADVRGTRFDNVFDTPCCGWGCIPIKPGTGITLAQLYSTASYQAHDLSGISLVGNKLAGANLVGQDLSNADLSGYLTNGLNGWTTTDLRNADFRDANLTNTRFHLAVLSGANFAGQNLTNAFLSNTLLTDADFTGAQITGASFGRDFRRYYFLGTGISIAQLYATASYQAQDLSGTDFTGNYLAGVNFSGQNLNNAKFRNATLTNAELSEANLTGADLSFAMLAGADVSFTVLGGTIFSDAQIRGASFNTSLNAIWTFDPGYGITLEQLYSTASYQAYDLSHTRFRTNALVGGNFQNQQLTSTDFNLALLANADFSNANAQGASFSGADLTDANFSGAMVQSASFDRISFGFGGVCCVQGGISPPQLYSTASYQAHDLSGISFSYNNLAGADFTDQNLTDAYFFAAILTGADFSGADLRGANLAGSHTNVIWSNRHIDGLELEGNNQLVVRDYDGSQTPIPLTVDQHLTMGPGGRLQMVFDADDWGSTISFEPGIPVTLGGTLELTFAADVRLASQVGRTFDLFDWTGVTPTGGFAVSAPYAWDLTNLYKTGRVTLAAIPEPSALFLVAFAVGALTVMGRLRVSQSLTKGNNQ